MKFVGRFGGIGHLDFRTKPRRGHNIVGHHRIVLDWSDEGFIPLLSFAVVGIYPVKMRLDIAILAGDITNSDEEEDVAGIICPAWTDLLTLVVSDTSGLVLGFRAGF